MGCREPLRSRSRTGCALFVGPFMERRFRIKEQNMKRLHSAASAIMALVFLTLLFGCTYVSVDTRRYPPSQPTLPPTHHGSDSPFGAHTAARATGRNLLEPQGNPTVAEMEAKLRQAAASMGADAAVIVADQMMFMGSYNRPLVGTRSTFMPSTAGSS